MVHGSQPQERLFDAVEHGRSASAQQQTVVTANYVGSGSRRLFIGGYYNTALTPGPGNPRARSPFPYILPTFYDRSWGRSNYHCFQFLLDKKFSNGLAYMVSYTLVEGHRYRQLRLVWG